MPPSTPVYTAIPATLEASADSAMIISDSTSSHLTTTGADAATRVDMKEFEGVVRMLGFLIGLLVMAVDLFGQLFLLAGSTTSPSFAHMGLLSACWSTASALLVGSLFALICKLLNLTLHPRREDFVKAVETHGLFWTFVGVAVGHAVADMFFLPIMQWCFSATIMLAFVGMFRLSEWCLRADGTDQETAHVEEEAHACYERLMVV